MVKKVYQLQKRLIIAADLSSLSELENLVKQTGDLEGVWGYKVGFSLGLRFGLPEVVKIIKRNSSKKVMYDHQKAGNDIPDTGEEFAQAMKFSKIDSTILFPFTSPKTQIAWTKALQKIGIQVLVGGHMSHNKFLEAEGGYIADDSPLKIYELAAKMGVHDFVVPGNKIDLVKKYREFLETKVKDPSKLTFYAPGLGFQGGSVEEFIKAAGKRYYPIVGRSITKAKNMKKAAEQVIQEININD
jgi:orotidine-5'-phosphate decarboxylase